MKKFAFILLVTLFIISACLPSPTDVTPIPQVTVTLTPPFPTPTLNPQFVELQETIAASGERFTLNPDGTIADGADSIPGLKVAPDGLMTLTVNGETVTIDPADVSLDDEKGISIEGFDFDSDANAWVEAISEARQEIDKLLSKYGLEDEVAEGKISVIEEGGVVSVKMKVGEPGEEVEKVIMRSSELGIQHDLEFAVDTVAKNSCEPRPELIPRSKDGYVSIEISKKMTNYYYLIRDELGYFGGSNGLSTVLIRRDGNCWGFIGDGRNLVYRNADGVAQNIRLIPMIQEEVSAFVAGR